MRGKTTRWIKSCVVLLIAVIVLGGAVTAVRAAIEATVAKTSEDGVLVGVNGTFSSATKEEVLNRINEIRKEACDEGISFNGVTLTAEDYNPIKWSSDLEWIAQARAAEAAVNESHTRPNGTSYSEVAHNSISSEAENLAWGEGMLESIEQWYAQKDAWVNNTGEETGYYLEMINPDYTYIGLGSFKVQGGNWVATAGEFSTTSETLDETKSTLSGASTPTVEVHDSSLSDLYVSGNTNIGVNETAQFVLEANTTNKNVYGKDLTLPVTVRDGAEWISSDTTVATVDQQGNVTGVSIGTVEVTVEAGDTKLIMEITVSDAPEAATEDVEEVTVHIEAEAFVSKSPGVEVSSEQYDGATVIRLSGSGAVASYDVEIPVSGYYKVSTRAASEYEGDKNISVYVDSVYSGQVTIKSTGASNYFEEFEGDQIYLSEGQHRIVFVAGTVGVCLEDWIEFSGKVTLTEEATEPSDSYPTVHIEAEDFTSQSGGVSVPSQKYAEATVVNSIAAGDTITYDVEILGTGDYTVDLRVSSQYTGVKTINVYVDSVYVTQVTMNCTGSWTVFDVFRSSEVYLEEGQHSVTLEANSGGSYLLDWIEFVGTVEAPEEAPEEVTTESAGESDRVVLNGNEEGEGSMIGSYTPPTSEGSATDDYKYLGYVSFLDRVPDTFIEEGNYRYLVMTYTGDITQLRFDFEHSEDGMIELQGSFWFNPEGHTRYFVSADGSDIPLVGANTTVVIDLLNSVHPDNGIDADGVDLSWYNTGLHMHCDMMDTYGDGKGITISNAYLTNTVPAQEKIIHIEAEDYDSMSGVELRGIYDQGTDGLKSVDAGDYMIYTVNVKETGVYRFDVRAARSDAGSSVLSLMENDIVIGTVSVVKTGGWGIFAEFEGTEVHLSAGLHTLKVYATGGRYNLNWYELVKVSDVNADASTKDIHIEAENYDSMSGVELRGTYDQGTDVLKSVDAGDYMIYTVDVQETGVYRFDVRAARNDTSSSVLSLMENDSVIATANVSHTGGWDTFAEFEGTKLYLTEGTHTLKVYADNGRYNLNWYELVFVAGDSVHIEAEDYDSMSGVELRGTYDQGTDVLKSVDVGDYMIYTVNMPVSGTYRFDVRAARSDTGSSVLSLMENESVIATISVDQTGGWETFAEFEGTEMYLTEGEHALKVYATGGRYNLNWYEFTIVSVDGQ